MEYQISRYSNLVVEVDIDLPMATNIPKHPMPVELIGLTFTLRRRRSHFHVLENGEQQLVEQQEIPRVPLCDHLFPIEIFSEGDNSLFQNLDCSFQNYRPNIDAELVADTLIERWIEIREQVHSRSSNRVFSMIVNLTMCEIVARHEIGNIGSVFGGEGRTGACGGAVKKMLRRVESGEEDRRVCVICMDELKKKKKKGRLGMEMPCLHVFHGNCIEEWLKVSHCCPICRFQMPISQ